MIYINNHNKHYSYNCIYRFIIQNKLYKEDNEMNASSSHENSDTISAHLRQLFHQNF